MKAEAWEFEYEEVLGLPPIDTVVPRNGSEHHGADHVAADYVGVSRPYPAPRGNWAHGWNPLYFEEDPQSTIAYVRLLEKKKEHFAIFTAHETPARILRELGWTAETLGMPVCYLSEVDVARRPGSLLVMPVHSEQGHRHQLDEQSYVESVRSLRPQFDEVVISVHPGCIANGYWLRRFQDAGFPIVRGCHWTDRNSLKRVQRMLSSFEYVTTNALGSHIGYAAFFGAKVSIWGPTTEWKAEWYTNNYLAVPGTDFVDLYLRSTALSVVRQHYPQLFCHPLEAPEQLEWGRREMGYENKVTPDKMRELFGWTEPELARYRRVGRYIEGARQSLRRLLPAPVKRGGRAILDLLAPRAH
jgi:hypothetical protein